MKTKKQALVLIDIQKGFDDAAWGPRNDEGFAKNVTRLLAAFRALKLPVIHVHHLSENPASKLRAELGGDVAMEFAAPLASELVIPKKVNSAFIGTPLDYWLRRLGVEETVLVGIATDHCVTTTARMGANLGFDIAVVSDATFAFDRALPNGKAFPAALVHEVTLASLSGEFARIVTTDELLQ